MPELRPRDGEAAQRQREDSWWLVRVWTLVLLFAVVTDVGWRHYGVPVRDPDGAWLVWRVALSLGLLVLLGVVDAGVRAGRAGWTPAKTLDVLRSRWTRGRLTLTLTGLAGYHVVYLCYHNLKSWDVFNEPRDGLLQQWDRWLFLGHSPAVLLHDLLGQGVTAYVLTLVYESFSSVVAVSLVAALVFTDRVRQGYVLVVAPTWVCVLGLGAYYLIPSLAT